MAELDRRSLMGACTLAPGIALSALTGCQRNVEAGPFPDRNITFIVPVAAGGGADIYSRFIGPAMKRFLPRKIDIVPRNIASGGGGKGITELFRAAPDGYTIGIFGVPGIFQLQKLANLPYDLERFAWLATLTDGEHYGIAVQASSPLRTFDDLRTLSRRRPITFSTTGPEGTAFSATVISMRMLGLRYRLVTGYRGSNDYVIGAMRGDTDAVVAALSVLRRMSQGSAMRVLATFEKDSSFPGAPGARALGQPDLALVTTERVIAAPPGLDPKVRDMLAHAVLSASADQNVASYAKKIGEKLRLRNPLETVKLVREQRAFFEHWIAG